MHHPSSVEENCLRSSLRYCAVRLSALNSHSHDEHLHLAFFVMCMSSNSATLIIISCLHHGQTSSTSCRLNSASDVMGSELHNWYGNGNASSHNCRLRSSLQISFTIKSWS